MSKQVSRIPEGFETVTPYVIVKNAAKAIELYKQAFGAIKNYSLPSSDGKGIGHACLTIGTSKLFIADECPQMNSYAPDGKNSSVSFYLYVQDADSQYKKAISAGMKELMPVQEMFWGDRMGALQDAYGYKWNLATKVKDMTQDEIEKAAQKAFSKAA